MYSFEKFVDSLFELCDEFVTIQVWNSSVKYLFRIVARHIWQPDIAENNKILLNGAFKNSSAFFCMSQHRKQNLCICRSPSVCEYNAKHAHLDRNRCYVTKAYIYSIIFAFFSNLNNANENSYNIWKNFMNFKLSN